MLAEMTKNELNKSKIAAEQKLETFKKETTTANSAVLAECESNLEISEKERIKVKQEEMAKN